jgi:phosphoglycolate phosphatase-like HAD superfamily hydrolase
MKAPAFILDLDGTLVDSVYDNVSVWHSALRKNGIEAPQWKIHRAIGMSGKLFLPKLLRELGHRRPSSLISRLETAHASRFSRAIPGIAALPGASELLNLLMRRKLRFVIATSGAGKQTQRLLRRIPKLPDCPVITADDVAAAKPAPDLFELAARKLDRNPNECFVVGDSIWDVLAARRFKASAVGLLTGGFDKRELQDAGAYRVYADAQELGESLEQLGISP